jgi:hypothetical protein
VAAIAATAGAVIADRAAGPEGGGTATLSAERAAKAQGANRKALANVQHALHVAQRARRIARRGRGKARTALATANALVDQVERALADAATALTNSSTALNRSDAALGAAQNANSRLDSTRIVSDAVSGVATTSSPTYERDPSSVGPQVTVTVPSSGLIEVWASVHMDDVEGSVGLFEDGQLVTLGDQIGGADCGTDHAILGTTGAGPVSLSTPPSFDGSGLACGTIGNAPAPILLNRSPGTHTYELRYADCGCFGGPSAFSERVLRVAPRL